MPIENVTWMWLEFNMYKCCHCVCVCVCERFLNDHSPLFEKMLTQQKRESIETWLWNRKNWERFRLCGPLGRLNGSWSFFSRMYLKCINCCLVPIVNGWSLFSLRFFFLCVSICYSILQRFSAYVRFKSPTNVEQEWAKNRDGINDNGNVDAIESRVNEMDRQHMNGISNFENHRKRFRFVSHFV